ncbi:MAG TPA: hypothetical protein VGX03_15425 [Candidatus Binatia bacterium]|nr:hypothetical protein [Candidatus Binatia bacterium]
MGGSEISCTPARLYQDDSVILGNAHGPSRNPPVGKRRRDHNAKQEGNIRFTAADHRQRANKPSETRIALRTEGHWRAIN